MEITTLSPAELGSLHADLQSRYQAFVAEKLSLDLTRGKPAPEQLDLSNALDGILEGFFLLQDGTDVRNYGGLLGIPEARALGAALLGTTPAETMAGGNSSLSLMYAYVDFMLRGAWAGAPVKFLCPVPGYDRHFTICEHFGIEMINVPLLDTGPDMDMIEDLVTADASIKGIWCVPKYSNPTGHTYSKATVERMAQLARHAGEHFRIMWDNAYVVHDLTEAPDSLENLMPLAHAAGTADSVVMLASTSKITFAGAGVAFLGTSTGNLAAFEKFLSASVIGFDKVNQLRHVRFLPDLNAIKQHMEKHQAIIKPRFDIVQEALTRELDGKGIASWTTPNGGYFISLDTLPGLASQVVKLAAEAGVKLTPAGATFPYGKDPANTNIRIAPTFPSTSQLRKAVEVLVVCIQLATVTMLLARQT
ncbi:MAG: aminotransferase class I/II-fold pyridoxal phosphate-dependent enzyme [Pseudomonadota bacterium]